MAMLNYQSWKTGQSNFGLLAAIQETRYHSSQIADEVNMHTSTLIPFTRLIRPSNKYVLIPCPWVVFRTDSFWPSVPSTKWRPPGKSWDGLKPPARQHQEAFRPLGLDLRELGSWHSMQSRRKMEPWVDIKNSETGIYLEILFWGRAWPSKNGITASW